ncbi:MAG: tRNA dihydrouridine synthase DusB [Proteobacteria bacterium]|nr:tRNA dihydrouridine synthase DusB [Pseudomonadota bacterium]
MRIGSYTIGEGAILAPMAGITNPPFRKICYEMGAALTVTALISSHALTHLSKKPVLKNKGWGEKTLTLLERFKGESPLAVQIIGRDPEKMVEAALYVEAEGAEILDLNFGCPARKVVKGGEGSGVALMRDPPVLQEIARRVVSSLSIPVTAKIRLGWSPDEQNAPEVAKRLEDAGVSAICVHARTRDKVHSGPVNLEGLSATCAAVKIPVIGNGGIRSLEDAEEMIARTGCQQIAVGQAAKGNPWIFKELRGANGSPDLTERIDLCRRHFELYVEWVGEQRAALEMRKHACWYIKGFVRAAALRKRLAEATDMEAFSRVLDEIPLD